MEFRKILTLGGPNIWANFPVLEAWVELGDLKDSASNEMPGFNERVMSWLPQMIEHRCSVGERGGFFQRLERGTYLAHILEHVTLELQARAGFDFGFGRARESTKEGLFRVAVRYEDENLGRACLETGRRLCLAALHDQPFDVAAEIKQLRSAADDFCLGPSSRAIVDPALARGIPVRRLNAGSLVQLGYGARSHRILTARTDRTSGIAEEIAQDKDLTRSLLLKAGVPVPIGRPVKSADDAWLATQEIGGPVVVKPRYGNQGRGVVIGISQPEEIEAAYHFAAQQGPDIMVEQLAQGAEHRLLVVGDKLIAASKGNPAVVIGDGVQTIAQLIESQLNTDPRRGDDLSFPLSRIELGPPVVLALKKQGYTGESVPAKGVEVLIQPNGNLAIDATDQVHPEVARAAVYAAQVVGLNIAGIDVVVSDIGQPLQGQGGLIIEVNSGPGLQMHVEPESGIPRPVGEEIVSMMFAPGENGRIPLACVTGNENTAPVVKLLGHILQGWEPTLAIASAEGITFGGDRFQTGDCRGASAAHRVLLNPLVRAALFETSLESIVEEGLGFEYCNVAVITSMGDGFKLDLAEGDTPEKKALAYRGASDIVTPEGALVLRAGEALGPILIAKCKGSVVLFSTEEKNALLAEHCAAGGRAVFGRGGQVTLRMGNKDIAVRISGSSAPNESTLAAVAAAWALGLQTVQIENRLKSFAGQL